MLWTGQTGLAAALAAAILVNLMMVLWNGYVRPGPRPFRLAIGNALLIALVARLFSPFLIAPGIAAVTAMMLTFSPTYRRVGPVLMLTTTMALAVVAPWLLELAGVISPTTTLTPVGAIIDAPGLHFSVAAKTVFFSLYAIALVAAATGMSHAMRSEERQNRQRMYTQAWQLRQLVPH